MRNARLRSFWTSRKTASSLWLVWKTICLQSPEQGDKAVIVCLAGWQRQSPRLHELRFNVNEMNHAFTICKFKLRPSVIVLCVQNHRFAYCPAYGSLILHRQIVNESAW